ncbi:Adaptive-response sensory-kinase SasA [Paenibacillus allorhizoplanae]|uniref:histidine kinase n=1 Tax=Paenibacillus allorhizoplanae TaxID=2905648 RepID=A0ABM9D0Y4_9BACL|nr:HAMP domain-containing sensor histidine kinase [Paenibacillus allorhizoplanae]CAH1230864.1 Adaptive-response sensory-kinase SasA [Paenibacillus allorhizoplanae]
MSTSSPERKTLLQYWTTRYVITLIIGLIVIGASSFYFLEFKSTQKNEDIGRALTEEIPTHMQVRNGRIEMGPVHFWNDFLIKKREATGVEFMTFVVDPNGRPIFSEPNLVPPEVKVVLREQTTMQMAEGVPQPISLQGNATSYFVKKIQSTEGSTVGYLYIVLIPSEIFKVPNYKKIVYVMFVVVFILGWGILYLLTRRLIKPLQDVVNATKQIKNGSYQVELNPAIKEKEIFELQESFSEMAKQLNQLDYLRNKLLAGVTHELKTPVTSISGLVQAVRDDVVTGEDAKHFLNLCFKETQHLQRMIEDLLEFNSYAVGAIKVTQEQTHLNLFIEEIIQQWSLTDKDPDIQVDFRSENPSVYIMTDGVRLKQVIVNVLNNAKAAMGDKGKIQIHLYEGQNSVNIDISDTGTGIPESEQAYIFESFFRGELKQTHVRGMGLGLSLCRNIMKELDGNIELKESSPRGTKFTISLKFVEAIS